MISIIIPAHNEAAMIERCLAQLRSGLSPDEAEILVVCNGCSDDTASRARRQDSTALVIESNIPSKIAALQLGDNAASGYPRFYVDADVSLTGEAVHAVVTALSQGGALAAAPRLKVLTEQCSWAVKSYYRTWLSLPYHREGMIGSGVYALSRAGRARFQEFPEGLIADDGYVHALFTPAERKTVEEAYFSIQAPIHLAGVIAIKTRSQKGLIQLRSRFPELDQSQPGQKRALLLRMLKPSAWLDTAVYVAVMLIAKRRAHRLQRDPTGMAKWERDESSRRVAGS